MGVSMIVGWRRVVVSRFLPACLGLLAFLAALAGPAVDPPPVAAQASAADQIRLLQSLSPTQRNAAMEALRQGGELSVLPRAGMGPFGLPTEAQATGGAEGTTPEDRAVGRAGDRMLPAFEMRMPPRRVRAGDTLAVGTREPVPAPANPEAVPPETPWDEEVYRVDRDGRLWLPGRAPIVVLGWTEAQAAASLSSLPFAKGLEVQVRILPRADVLAGLDLRPFGYDVLSARVADYKPDPNAPVPRDYVVGVGDTFLIQMFGKDNQEYALGVTRDGTLLLPKFGPLQVAGLTFDEARDLITGRVKAQAIGVDVAVTMGQLRSIQVFVLGDVSQPGARVLSAFATPLHALLAAGGVAPNGSLRHVEVKRGGKVVSRVDLYSLLLSGDTSGYGRLQAGDVVFVPPVSALVAVAGQVRRPAVYELKGGETVTDMLALAGGIAADGDQTAVRMQRPGPAGGQQIVDLAPDMLDRPVADGDLVQVFPRVGPLTHTVTVRGHVASPGLFAWHEGLRLSDLMPSPVGVLADTDPAFVLVARPDGAGRTYLQSTISEALAQPGGPADIVLNDGDEVFVFGRDEDRSHSLAPEVALLKRLAVAGRLPDRTVAVQGEVHFPGVYPLTREMRLTDLLAAAGDVNERAYPYEVEITRFSLAPHGEGRETEHMLVDLSRAREGADTDNVTLRPNDRVSVRPMPDWQGETVAINGEVRFPGVYVIEAGETVGSLVARAGGLTEEAFLPGAVFQRESVRAQEQEEIDRLAHTFEQDMVRVATEPATFGSGDRGQALGAGRELLRLIRQTRATGRMSLTLDQDKAGQVFVKEAALRLMGGDALYIPRRPDSVLVVGEVYHPTAHLYRKGESVRDYIGLSGGVNKRGNASGVLVVHANGSVTKVRVGMFSGGLKVALGDTIVVPQKLVTFSSLKLATDVTQILYQLALTAASAKAIGVF